MATPTPATLPEFKKYLQKSTAVGPDDAEMLSMLEAATEACEGWSEKGRTEVGPIVAREFTDRVRADRNGVLMLPHSPVISITSLTSVLDGTVYTEDDLDPRPSSGLVTGLRTRLAGGPYDAVYEAGRDPVPVALKEATLVIGKHLWESQRGPGRKMRGEDTDNRAQWAGAGYLIPNRAAHLLIPFTSVISA